MAFQRLLWQSIVLLLFQPRFAGLNDTFDSAEIETEMGDLDDIGDEVKINVK